MAPELCIDQGLTPDEAVEAILAGFDKAASGRPIEVGLLVTAMRHAARATEIAEVALRHRDQGVVPRGRVATGERVRAHRAAPALPEEGQGAFMPEPLREELAYVRVGEREVDDLAALPEHVEEGRVLETRERLRHAMVDAFSLKAFHDALLSRGAIPVPLAVALVHTDLPASTPS